MKERKTVQMQWTLELKTNTILTYPGVYGLRTNIMDATVKRL